jgi:predicted small metal-binding protein
LPVHDQVLASSDALNPSSKERPVAKVLACREVGMDCDYVARGNSEEEILAQAAVHAQHVHGMQDISPEVLEKVKSVIHDE